MREVQREEGTLDLCVVCMCVCVVNDIVYCREERIFCYSSTATASIRDAVDSRLESEAVARSTRGHALLPSTLDKSVKYKKKKRRQDKDEERKRERGLLEILSALRLSRREKISDASFSVP